MQTTIELDAVEKNFNKNTSELIVYIVDRFRPTLATFLPCWNDSEMTCVDAYASCPEAKTASKDQYDLRSAGL